MDSAAIQRALTAGPKTAPELRDELDVSQPTLSRALTALRTDVAKLGRGRTTRYALRRRIRELPPELPIHRVSTDGRAQRIGTLHTIAPDRYWYHDEETPRASAEFYSVPWFMTDLRPQGYLGRFFPQIYSDLGLPVRITDWNEDQALYAIARRGEDLPGNLLVGDESLARWLAADSQPPACAQAERAVRYGALASNALGGRPPGSSAAGEQPKFGATVTDASGSVRHVLVKFSAPLTTVGGRRWADLLLAEHLASVVLTEHGHSAVRSEYVCDATRAFLEVQRFDRVGARGRHGVVSLGALDDEFVGERLGWSESAAALLRAGLIRADDARELRYLSAFGALIGNTDMHLGNASFLVEGPGRLRLAPAYDMLPMLYAPVADELHAREFVPAPKPGQADQWRAAMPAAREFWLRLAGDTRASAEFRQLATTNARAIGPSGA